MAKFVKGDVVVVPFPFSDLSNAKKRPALVVTSLIGDDVILCQITTQTRADGYSVPITNTDFASGGLPQNSSVRPNRIFTADSAIILSNPGRLKKPKINEILNKIIQIIKS